MVVNRYSDPLQFHKGKREKGKKNFYNANGCIKFIHFSLCLNKTLAMKNDEECFFSYFSVCMS